MILLTDHLIAAAENKAAADRAAVLKTPEKSAAEAYHKARAASAESLAEWLRALGEQKL